jgi:superfamily II helicase
MGAHFGGFMSNKIHKSHKICKRCYKHKRIKEFSLSSSNHDGHGSYCRECAAEVHAIWHRRAQEKKAEKAEHRESIA